MATTCSAYIACSLDGFIAKKDGNIDWLTTFSAPDANEDYGYRTFMDSVDAIVLGRVTYELALTFGAWPYGTRKVFVLSRKYPKQGKSLEGAVIGTSAAPGDLTLQMSDSGIRHAYVDGGQTIQSFVRDDLLNDLTITRVPILLGEGLPLFGLVESEKKLTHIETRIFTNGFIQSKYEFAGGA